MIQGRKHYLIAVVCKHLHHTFPVYVASMPPRKHRSNISQQTYIANCGKI